MNYSNHLYEEIKSKLKANQGICVIWHLYHYFPRKVQLQIYKSFIRPNLDYCRGPFQYNAAFAITDFVRGTSREKLYSEFSQTFSCIS